MKQLAKQVRQAVDKHRAKFPDKDAKTAWLNAQREIAKKAVAGKQFSKS